MDTGRASTIYGQSLDSLLGKSFFAKNDLLPRDYRLEALHTFPTPDFQNLGAGSFAINKSKGVYTAVSSSRGNFGWNFGADKTRALFVVSGLQGVLNRVILFLNDAQPNTNEAAGANALGFRVDVATGAVDLGSIGSASGWNNLTGWTAIIAANTNIYAGLQYYSQSMAIYVDTSGGGVVKGFLRLGMHNWVEVLTATSAYLSKVRCATILASPAGAADQVAVAPVGIYAE